MLRGNIEIFSKEGDFLFHANEKKLNWYLSRNLAKENQSAPGSYCLTFTPKRKNLYETDDPYLFQKIENKCVVCGTENDLKKHHVFPRCFGRHLSSKQKEQLRKYATHDILIVCLDCHEKYEIEACKIKNYIIEKYGKLHKSDLKSYRVCCLLNSMKNAPDEVKTNLELKARLILNDLKTPLTELLETYKNIKYARGNNEPFKLYLSKMTENELEDYIKFWREHFVEKTGAKFLPELWEAGRKVLNG